MTIVCNRNTVRESFRISFFCGGALFYEVVRRPENTQKELIGLFERLTDLTLHLND